MNIEKYLDEVVEKIKKLQNEGHFEDALELISQELQSSYIPAKYLTIFEHLYMDASREHSVKTIENKYEKMSKPELMVASYNGRKIDVSVLSYFLAKFHGELSDVEFDYFNNIFLDRNINNVEKIFILEQFKQCEINHTFEYFNKDTDKQFEINSMDTFEFDATEYWMFLAKDLEQRLFKEPSLIPMASELARIIYENYFGMEPPYTNIILAEKLSAYVQSYFNESNQEADKDFNIWIKKILKENKALH